MPIEITQNEIPTRSSDTNKSVFAFTVHVKANKAIVTKENSLSFFTGTLFFNNFDIIYIIYTLNKMEGFFIAILY